MPSGGSARGGTLSKSPFRYTFCTTMCGTRYWFCRRETIPYHATPTVICFPPGGFWMGRIRPRRCAPRGWSRNSSGWGRKRNRRAQKWNFRPTRDLWRRWQKRRLNNLVGYLLNLMTTGQRWLRIFGRLGVDGNFSPRFWGGSGQTTGPPALFTRWQFRRPSCLVLRPGWWPQW